MRFILLFVLGSLLVVGSQVALSLGIHPDHLASLRYIIQSGTGLAIGTAIAATGTPSGKHLARPCGAPAFAIIAANALAVDSCTAARGAAVHHRRQPSGGAMVSSLISVTEQGTMVAMVAATYKPKLLRISCVL